VLPACGGFQDFSEFLPVDIRIDPFEFKNCTNVERDVINILWNVEGMAP